MSDVRNLLSQVLSYGNEALFSRHGFKNVGLMKALRTNTLNLTTK